MSNLGQFYLLFMDGMIWLMLMVQLGGFVVCLSYRRLSSRLLVVSAGFAGLGASGALSRLALTLLQGDHEKVFLSFLIASVGGLASMLLMIFGLAASFADIRRRLALSMEPPHVRK